MSVRRNVDLSVGTFAVEKLSDSQVNVYELPKNNFVSQLDVAYDCDDSVFEHVIGGLM